ncbi:MAG: prepilin-type N-terminal cleavage/methylation domain-containing protein [Alphaproteobacteria bacterium]|nr:prepilin-type N-terminal cleavage/methylation domain-containing protein [Alphaproteobacteria bacterium]MBL7098333.1 prepilin-type N-terminal cleavage/methylation domain-containing protein [Alphaproteobacteria bacterium]
MTRRAGERGFTLVETLVALAIVGLSCAVLFKVISDQLDRTRRAQDDMRAMSRVESLLAAATVGTPQAERGFYPDGSSWQVDVTPALDPQAQQEWPVDVVRVAATVTWREDGHVRSRRLTTLRVVAKEPER